MYRRLSYLSAMLALVMPLAARASILLPGDPAPPLAPGTWLKGDPVKAFEKGRIYVVEFWATWCVPCRDSIPHLSELQARYPDVVFIGQDCFEESQAGVPAFVRSMGDKMSYRVALDDVSAMKDGRMAGTWLQPAGQSGIPVAFLVDRDTKIAWIGHPSNLEPVLKQVIAGTFNAAPQPAAPAGSLPPSALAYYTAASARVVAPDLVKAMVLSHRIGSSIPGIPQYSLDEQIRVLEMNREALHLAREGFDFPAETPTEVGFATPTVGGLSRLLSLEVEVKEAQQNWAWSANTGLDFMRVEIDLSRGAHILSPRLCAGVHDAGRTALYRALPHLGPGPARAALLRLRRIAGGRPSAPMMLKALGEGAAAEEADTFRDPNWRENMEKATELLDQISAALEKHPDRTLHQAKGYTLKRLREFTEAQLLARCADYRARLEAYAAHPYSARHSLPPIPGDPLNKTKCDMLSFGYFWQLGAAADDSLFSAALAVQAYRGDHGRYPARLEELIPTYLDRVTPDPFAGGHPIHFRSKAGHVLIYSVGPDGVDNGGVVSSGPHLLWMLDVLPRSRGDIMLELK